MKRIADALADWLHAAAKQLDAVTSGMWARGYAQGYSDAMKERP